MIYYVSRAGVSVPVCYGLEKKVTIPPIDKTKCAQICGQVISNMLKVGDEYFKQHKMEKEEDA